MLNIIGLPNISNTCYINSTLQVLNSCKYFDKFIESHFWELNYKSIFQESNSEKRLLLYKKYITNLQKNFPTYFNILEQNDVQEFLMLYIDCLYEKVKINYKKEFNIKDLFQKCEEKWLTNYSPIQNIFYYQSIRQVQCSNCLNKNVNIEMSNIICIEPNIDIDTALDNYFQSHFQDDWICDKCNIISKTNRVSTYLSKLPKVIIICIKRFDIHHKNDNNIPMTIDFEKYSIKSSNTKYELFSTIEHIGSLNYGHYYTRLFIDDEIYIIDDEIIKKIKKNTVNDKNTYVLFYQQIIHQY